MQNIVIPTPWGDLVFRHCPGIDKIIQASPKQRKCPCRECYTQALMETYSKKNFYLIPTRKEVQ